MEGEKPRGLREGSTEGCSPQYRGLGQQAGGRMKEKKKKGRKRKEEKKRTSYATVNGVESLLKEPCLSH